MSARKKLMEEIYDQFLVCKICFDVYSRPKTLSCLHTFCENCIAKQHDAERQRAYRYMLYASSTVTCPLCRKKTDLPPGGVRRLPDNFVVPRLVDIVCGPSKQHHVTPDGPTRCYGMQQMALTCEICKSSKSPSRGGTSRMTGSLAVSKCLDCCKMLCSSCTELHRRTKVTEQHSLVDVEVEEKDVACRTHDGELIRFYCEPCGACICVVCAFQQPHHDHDVSTFSEAISRHRHALDGLLARCRDRAEQLRSQLQLSGRWALDIRTAEQQVRDAVVDCVAAVRRRETELLTQLRAAFAGDPAVQAFIADRPSIEATLRGLENTCQLTDIIVRERSVELLLLKDDIANRMTSLLQTSLAEPPPHMHSSYVRFIPTPRDQGLPVGRLDFVDDSVPPSEEARPDGDGNESLPDEADDSDDESKGGGYKPEVEIKRRKVDNDAVGEEEKEEGMSRGDAMRRLRSTSDRDTMTNQVSVESVSTTMDRCVHVVDKLTATSPQQLLMVDRSTLTVRPAQPCDRSTETSPPPDSVCTPTRLVNVTSQTSTSIFQLKSKLVETEPLPVVNRGTSTERPFQMDKKTSTVKTLQSSRETNTTQVFRLDVGVDRPRFPGNEVACSTKVIITADASTVTDTLSHSIAAVASSLRDQGRKSNDDVTQIRPDINRTFIPPISCPAERGMQAGHEIVLSPVCQDLEDVSAGFPGIVCATPSSKNVLVNRDLDLDTSVGQAVQPSSQTKLSPLYTTTEMTTDSSDTAMVVDAACNTPERRYETAETNTTTRVDVGCSTATMGCQSIAICTEAASLISRRASSMPPFSRPRTTAEYKRAKCDDTREAETHEVVTELSVNIPEVETTTTYQSSWVDDQHSSVAEEQLDDSGHDNGHVTCEKQVPLVLCACCKRVLTEKNHRDTQDLYITTPNNRNNSSDSGQPINGSHQRTDDDQIETVFEDGSRFSSRLDAAEVRFEDRGVGTENSVEVVDCGVGEATVKTESRGDGDGSAWTVDAETWTQSVVVVDRGTGTRSVHMMHKNEATENQRTVDAGTSPAEDVTSAYRGLLAAVQRPPVTVSRGTATAPSALTTDRETATEHRKLVDCGTSPPVDVTAMYRGAVGARLGSAPRVTVSRGTLTNPPPTQCVDKDTTTNCTMVDRASSPVKVPGVDKSVLVNRAALTEPTDVFVRSAAARSNGNKMAPTAMRSLHQRLSGSCPRMDSICERSDEGSSSSDNETGSTPPNSHRKFPPPTRPEFSPRSAEDALPRRSERLGYASGLQGSWKTVPRGPDGPENAVLERRVTAVEAGTNTSRAELADKSTGTDTMCNAVVDGKMAECISKLRTVRQRLEQQQSSTPRNTSPPDDSSPSTPPQPINAETMPSLVASTTSLQDTVPEPDIALPPRNNVEQTVPQTVSLTSSLQRSYTESVVKDEVAQTGDHDDEVQQFISELKSRALQDTSSDGKRTVPSVPGRRFPVDRQRTGNFARHEPISESLASSPRPRRSNPADRQSARPSSVQRSYSPRARPRTGRPLDGQVAASPHQVESPPQRRSTTGKKMVGVSSPPTTRTRGAPTDRSTTPHSARVEAAGINKSPGSSPRKTQFQRKPIRPPPAAAASERLTTIDDDQARSTSDSDSLLTHSGGSSDDQDPPPAGRLAATPKLARKQRLDMTQLLLTRSASLPESQTGGATSVKQRH